MSTFAAVAIRIDGTADADKSALWTSRALDKLEEDLQHRMKSVQAIHIPSGVNGINGTLILIGTGELPE